MVREIKYFEALREATDICMGRDESVFVMGLGVPDPAGTFGSTTGLNEKYGSARVIDTPISENAITGIALGASIVGMRPIMIHIRFEFALLAMEQIVNQAAKWRYMFGGQSKAPLVIRMIVGRGWGQGAQHSQSLHAWLAHIPGLKVIMPATPHDAKGLLISAIEDDNPVVSIEHRWLYDVSGPVPEGYYTVPLGVPKVLREGKDVTFVASSYSNLEATRAAELMAAEGIDADIIDLRTINPFDPSIIIESVQKTGHLVVADQSWHTGGFAAEVIASVAELAWEALKAPPQRVTLPNCPTPTTRALSNYYYPRIEDYVLAARRVLGREGPPFPDIEPSDFLDIPDKSFTGPF